MLEWLIQKYLKCVVLILKYIKDLLLELELNVLQCLNMVLIILEIFIVVI